MLREPPNYYEYLTSIFHPSLFACCIGTGVGCVADIREYRDGNRTVGAKTKTKLADGSKGCVFKEAD